MAARSRARVIGSRRRRIRFDVGLLAVVGVLLLIGLMAVYSATFDWSYQQYHNSFHIAGRQLLWMGLGLAAMAAVASVPYTRWQEWALPIMGGALFLLVLVLVVGDDRFGARRTFFNGSVQPSELAKLATIIYVAAWLASKGEQVRDVTYGLVPFAVLIGVVAGLIVLQPDVSMAVLIVLTALAMFFFAGADIVQLAVGGSVSLATFWVLVNHLPHARRRLDEYAMVWRDPTLVGYHIRQSLIALGSGGLFGVGPGRGEQKLGYLPAPHTDSIFAVIGEEWGLVGCLVVILLFVALAYRGYRIALAAPDAFAALLACGVTSWLTIQAFINIGVISGLLPFTGVALPFISAGGSALVVSLMGVGLLLSVSQGRRGKRKGYRRANLDRWWRNGGARLSRSGRRAGSR